MENIQMGRTVLYLYVSLELWTPNFASFGINISHIKRIIIIPWQKIPDGAMVPFFYFFFDGMKIA